MTVYPRPPRKYIDFGKLMGDTWRLTWRHKFLWFFGLFAGGGTALGGWSGNFNYGGGAVDDSGTTTSNASRELTDWVNAHWTLLIGLMAAAVALALVLWLWSIVCRGAVIGSVRDIRRGEKSGFGIAFKRGRESFWRLLIFDLFLLLLALGFAVIIAALILMFFLLAAMAGTAGAIILTVIGLWFLTFVGFGMGFLFICTIWFVPWVFISLIVMFAMRSVVLEGTRPMAALRRGGRIMIDNLTQSLFMFLVSVGLGIAAIILLVMATGASAIPAVIAWVVAYDQGWPIPVTAAAAVLLVLPLMAAAVGVALMNTYFTAFWTIGFDKLAGNEPADEPFAAGKYKNAVM
ncbi:MAG: hypothetical protein M1539_00255 [Actinobacteria bacterium]|nr:hypothetical protein [Actinomycetota bacterium]MCL5882409.1 hypothetical protein [Actinomycetota bacterium]